MKTCTLLAFAGSALLAVTSHGEIITTLNEGSDWTLARAGSNSNDVDNRLLVKNSSANDGTDRVAFLSFDASSLTAVTAASVRLDIERPLSTGPDNQFRAGETIELWGVPDLDANEGLTQPAASATAYEDNPFTSDADSSDNLLDDGALVFLGSYTFPAETDGDVVDFTGSAVTSFVQADTNDVLLMLVTAQASTDVDSTVLFFGEDSTGSQFYPSVLTNDDAILPIPEPASLALLGLSGLAMLGRRRVR